jgi:hypothetical protein
MSGAARGCEPQRDALSKQPEAISRSAESPRQVVFSCTCAFHAATLGPRLTSVWFTGE